MAPHATEPLNSENSISVEPDITPQSPGDSEIKAVAVVGMSLGFPQDVTSSDAFWKILMEQRNTATSFPPSRLNINAMYHPDSGRRGQVCITSRNFDKCEL